MRIRHMNLWGAVRAYAVWGAAVLLAIFGAGFTFRQIAIGGIAVVIWRLGNDVWKDAYGVPPFNRIKFRFQLSYLGKALLDSGIYTAEELRAVHDSITDALTGRGWIYFTWLEPRLYYLNTSQAFSSDPEFTLNLKTFRNGVEVSPMQHLPDQLVFRQTEEGYELVLISSEQRHSDEWPRPYQLPGTLLFKIPIAALWALQGKHGVYRRHEIARGHMEAKSNLKYTEIPEIRNGWDYENQYGSFRWWYI